MSELKQRIAEDVKQAMRARDRERLGALRLLQAAIKQKEVDERRELGDADVIAVVEKMIKQRRESVRQYQEGGRPELAQADQAEIEVLEAYLPKPLDESELEALIDEAIRQTGASTMRDMGAVMAALRPRVAGRADMAQVSARVKARLG